MNEIGHHQLRDMSKRIREAREEKYLHDCKDRLTTIINTKIRTSFIGALDAFENSFGELWGHGLQDSQLTDDQRQCRIIWDSVRRDILTIGNGQMRAATNEIANHVVKWKRYTMTLPVINTKELKSE